MSRANLKQLKMPTSLPPHLILNLSAQDWHPSTAGRKGSGVGGGSLYTPLLHLSIGLSQGHFSLWSLVILFQPTLPLECPSFSFIRT